MQDPGLHRCPTITLSIIKLILFSLSDITFYLEEIRKDFNQPISTTSISEHKKEPEINSQATYYLLNFAARRDLSREALFLWINPLEAAPSIAL